MLIVLTCTKLTPYIPYEYYTCEYNINEFFNYFISFRRRLVFHILHSSGIAIQQSLFELVQILYMYCIKRTNKNSKVQQQYSTVKYSVYTYALCHVYEYIPVLYLLYVQCSVYYGHDTQHCTEHEHVRIFTSTRTMLKMAKLSYSHFKSKLIFE